MKYKDNIQLSEKIKSKVWLIIYRIFIWPFSSVLFNSYRIFLYRLFGAKLGNNCSIHSSARLLAPWNFVMGSYSTIGPGVKIDYGMVEIGYKVTISQGCYFSTGSHDISSFNLPYYSRKIKIGDLCWIAGEVFIGAGVQIQYGSVVGARSVVFKNIESMSVCVGNPIKKIKTREISDINEFKKIRHNGGNSHEK